MRYTDKMVDEMREKMREKMYGEMIEKMRYKMRDEMIDVTFLYEEMSGEEMYGEMIEEMLNVEFDKMFFKMCGEMSDQMISKNGENEMTKLEDSKLNCGGYLRDLEFVPLDCSDDDPIPSGSKD